jgi:hypothetical protein
MKRSILAFGLALSLASAASAVPSLQLDILGGTYADGDIVTSADVFTVYALATPSGNIDVDAILGGTYVLSIALTPKVDSAATLGSFDVNGATYQATGNMTYGVPPIESNGTAGHDGGDLGDHGIYDTYFAEISFQFSAANTSAEYNTEDDAGQGPIPGTGMYYASFGIDKSLLDDDYQLHFDLYKKGPGQRAGDLDIADFAPPSHDASTVAPPVPEPTAALVFGTALAITSASFRRRS